MKFILQILDFAYMIFYKYTLAEFNKLQFVLYLDVERG